MLKTESTSVLKKERNPNSCCKDENGEGGLSHTLAFLEAILFRHCVLEFPGICLLLEYLHTLWKLYLKMLCTLSKEPAGMPEIVSALFMSLK